MFRLCIYSSLDLSSFLAVTAIIGGAPPRGSGPTNPWHHADGNTMQSEPSVIVIEATASDPQVARTAIHVLLETRQ